LNFCSAAKTHFFSFLEIHQLSSVLTSLPCIIGFALSQFLTAFLCRTFSGDWRGVGYLLGFSASQKLSFNRLASLDGSLFVQLFNILLHVAFSL
jgi:hypothetical protein